MDFWIGLGVGIAATFVATLVVGALVLYFLLRDPSTVVPQIEPAPEITAPAVTVLMVEPFLNQQLRAALEIEAKELQQETIQVTHARVPFGIKLNQAALQVHAARRADFTAQMSVSAWGLKINVRPTTEFFFVPQAGRVKILVTRVQIQGFTVPRKLIENFIDEVVELAQARLNHSLVQLQQDTGVELADIETTEDLMILKFNGLAAADSSPTPVIISQQAVNDDSIPSDS